ncbi:murein hydrolase activator EnvC family protein [Brevibacillus sp. SYSU BS000544]|uniref:murein hydrolase activator EnvC family protein n=1 Tax=Brevibacillus sp. SYSU BS000544 TaxID=3416443 RepID=UPI003CE4A0C9
MNKKVILAVTITSLLAWGLVPSSETWASKASLEKINRDISALRAKKKAQQQQIRNIEYKISNIKKQRHELEDELMAIDLRRNETQNKIEKLDQQIDVKTNEAVAAQEKLDEAKDRVAKRESLLKTRLKTMYERGAVSYAEVLLGSSDFGDFLTRLQGLQFIVEQDTRILEENIQDKTEVEQKKKEVETRLAELEAIFSEQENLKAELDQQYQHSVVIKKELQSKEAELHEIAEEEEEQLIALARQEAAKLAEKSRMMYAQGGSYKGGKLGLPIASGSYRLSSGFGARKDPITGRSAGHNGLDMAAPRGTTIVAAEKGLVIFAGYSRGFGNTVMIKHNEEITTLYGHIREGGIKVKVGQVVTRGQKIAEVGSTGRSTGNHLHFTVYKNNTAVNPTSYLR